MDYEKMWKELKESLEGSVEKLKGELEMYKAVTLESVLSDMEFIENENIK